MIVFLLNYLRNTCEKHEQYRAFEEQLKLAAKWLKPIVIHSRDAYPKTFELLKQVIMKIMNVIFKTKIFCFD